LLRGHPEVIAAAAERDSVSFEWLVDVFGDALLSHQELDDVAADERLGRTLAGSYLPVITAGEWNHGTVLAGSRPPVEAEWWVTMVPAGSTGRGLTAPEDATATERISLFGGPRPASDQDSAPASTAAAKRSSCGWSMLVGRRESWTRSMS
jgi:hypothetical protein